MHLHMPPFFLWRGGSLTIIAVLSEDFNYPSKEGFFPLLTVVLQHRKLDVKGVNWGERIKWISGSNLITYYLGDIWVCNFADNLHSSCKVYITYDWQMKERWERSGLGFLKIYIEGWTRLILQIIYLSMSQIFKQDSILTLLFNNSNLI